jgi:hypothetical protein
VFDIVSQVVIGVYGSLEEAQLKKTELEEKLKSTRKLACNDCIFYTCFASESQGHQHDYCIIPFR